MTAPILILMIDEFIPGQPLRHRLPASALNWFELALATPVVLWGAWPFFQRGWASVINRSLNMFTLIALDVGAAYAFSVAATVAPGLFPPSFRIDGQVAVYFEPAAVIVVLVLLGQVLELRARSQTSSAIRNLLSLVPKTARKIGADAAEQDIPLEHVQVGHGLDRQQGALRGAWHRPGLAPRPRRRTAAKRSDGDVRGRRRQGGRDSGGGGPDQADRG